MSVYIDMIGETILLKHAPKRIVSLVPSQTELLFDLGLENEVVGITKFCIHPKTWFENKTRVGGTKTVNIEKVKALQPDLIIANKEENTKTDIASLSAIAPVWTSDIYTLTDAQYMINQLGLICDKEKQAFEISQQINLDFMNLPFKNLLDKSVAYFIWNDPLMVAAQNNFIDDILKRLGFKNIFEHKTRYPETNWDELQTLNPDFVFLSSEPYPFKEKHIQQFQEKLPSAKIIIVDGEMFSWYGSRLQHALSYFKATFKAILS